ncbi:MAG: tetratricopeptide repeat protein [Candidatus Lokiarchaeota archaeon]|nr:tetratricopeptide repeat protein [Candidatus Harpocratesius repetitus]
MPDENEYQKVLELISYGKFDEAFKKIKPMLKSEPENPGLLLDAGYICANLGNFTDAIKYYEKTIEMVPDSASGYAGLGFVYNLQDQPEKALEYFKKGLEKSPDNALIHFEVGETLLEMERFEEALKSYYKAIQFSGSETEVETLHRIAQVHLGMNNPDKTLEIAKNILSIDPSYATIYYVMAGAEAMKENWDSAKSHLEKYLKYSPEDVDAKEMLKHIEEEMSK